MPPRRPLPWIRYRDMLGDEGQEQHNLLCDRQQGVVTRLYPPTWKGPTLFGAPQERCNKDLGVQRWHFAGVRVGFCGLCT